MAGPVGYIFHNASGKLIHARGGDYDPPDGTNIVINNDTTGPARLQYRFIPQEGEWGYIEHISSGKVIYPLGINVFFVISCIFMYTGFYCKSVSCLFIE